MNSDFDYNGFPASFAHCFNGECSRGATCLRRQVALRIPQDRACVYAINPGHFTSGTGESCPHFRLDKPQRYARGISHLFDEVPLKKALAIKSQMMSYLGRTNYYRCNRKERLIKPAEQAYIQQLFRNQHVHDEPKFDEYLDYYDLT